MRHLEYVKKIIIKKNNKSYSTAKMLQLLYILI